MTENRELLGYLFRQAYNGLALTVDWLFQFGTIL